MTSPYALTLYNSVKRGSARVSEITKRAANWRRSIRRVGGYWMGSFEYKGNRAELDDMFIDGLMREVRETSGGITNWQGFIGDMEYTRDGVVWRRSMTGVCNSAKVMFTRQFDNILTNGSAESGAWTVFNGATVTQDTTWVADGDYSCKIVVADTTIRGATIQSGIILAADTTYVFQMQVNVAGGSWRIQINKTSDDSKVVATSTRAAQGVQQINLTVMPNTYVGSTYIRITSEASAGTIYGDAAVFQVAPQPADTGWIQSAASISEWGRIDEILLEGSLSAEAASAKAATYLAQKSWPRLLPPDTFQDNSTQQNRLIVTCYGYVFTLLWRMNSVYGTYAMSSVVTNLLSGIGFVTAGIIDTNSTSYTIENRVQLPIWQVLKTLVTSGDATGNLWQLGVYDGRKLNYTQFSNSIAYKFRGGKLYNVAGGLFEPWLAQPGWMSLDDAPIIPMSITTSSNDTSLRALIEEVEFVAPDKINLSSRASD